MLETLGAVLTVCLVMSPGIPQNDRGRAAMLNEAQAVWQPHGVLIRSDAAGRCDRLIVVKPDTDARPEDYAHEAALGWVPFVAGQARRVIFLRVARAHAQVGAIDAGARPKALTELLVARFLGRVLAHELGHVLLNSTQHRVQGLMRSRYRAHDVLRSPITSYTLDATERAQFFAATGRELRLVHR